MSNVNCRIEVITGDITAVTAEAIVNAANESLLGGGGVDGAIHRAAGPRLIAYNRELGGCPTGAAKMTPAFNLRSRGIRYIIHTVGPVWHGDDSAPIGDNRDDVLLASCYQQCLGLAAKNGLRTVAFPAISTGVYRFPKQRAAQIAVDHIAGWQNERKMPERVILCCFSQGDAQVYRSVMQDRGIED